MSEKISLDSSDKDYESRRFGNIDTPIQGLS